MPSAAVTIIDPREEARVLAWHLGREKAAEGSPPLREPVAPVLECAADVRTAEIEHVMQGVPS